jgi:GxxExxY protein
MNDIIFKEESYRIIGAAMEVHKELGQGFTEPVYQEALEIEFTLKNIPYYRQKNLNIFYKQQKLTKHYLADFVCFDNIIVELKALSELTGDHEAQVLNYLKASKLKLGLLINFGTKSLQFKRLVL